MMKVFTTATLFLASILLVLGRKSSASSAAEELRTAAAERAAEQEGSSLRPPSKSTQPEPKHAEAPPTANVDADTITSGITFPHWKDIKPSDGDEQQFELHVQKESGNLFHDFKNFPKNYDFYDIQDIMKRMEDPEFMKQREKDLEVARYASGVGGVAHYNVKTGISKEKAYGAAVVASKAALEGLRERPEALNELLSGGAPKSGHLDAVSQSAHEAARIYREVGPDEEEVSSRKPDYEGTPWQAAAKAVREHLLDMGDTELYGPKVDDEEYDETFQVANAAALEKKNTIDAAARQIEAENAAAMVPQGANGNLRQAVREHAGEIAVACAGVIAYWCMYS